MIYFSFFIIFSTAIAAGKKPLPPTESHPEIRGKKIIKIENPKTVEIELPNLQVQNIGYDYFMRLTSNLANTGQYVIESDSTERQALSDEEYVWSGDKLSAIELKTNISVMSFATGSRGTKMFYGFDEKNPRVEIKNEFQNSLKHILSISKMKSITTKNISMVVAAGVIAKR